MSPEADNIRNELTRSELRIIINYLDILCKKCSREIQSESFSRAFLLMNEFNKILKRTNQLGSDLVGNIEPIKRSNPDEYFSADNEERLRVMSKIIHDATKLRQKLDSINPQQ